MIMWLVSSTSGPLSSSGFSRFIRVGKSRYRRSTTLGDARIANGAHAIVTMAPGKEDLVDLILYDAGIAARLDKHKGEFTDLGERQTGSRCILAPASRVLPPRKRR